MRSIPTDPHKPNDADLREMTDGNQAGKSGLGRVLMNVAFITGSNITGRLLTLVLHAALARAFGAEGLGGLATAVAISTYFVFLVDFGTAPRLEREGATSPVELGNLFAEALGFKLALSVPAAGAVVLLALFLPFDGWVVELCVLIAIASIIRSFAYTTQAVCRARERIDLVGVTLVLDTAAFVGTSLIALGLGLPLVSIGYASIFAALVQLGSATLFARRFISFSIRFPPRLSVARAALPYATTSLSVLAFAQIDVLIMAFIESTAFVGRYSAVSRLLLIAGTLGVMSTSAILPTAARVFANATSERFDEIINGAIRLVVAIGLGASAGVAIIAEPLLATIYGPDFVELTGLLRLGAPYLAFKFAVSILGVSLTSIGRQGDRARSVLLGLVATVVFVLTLVPVLGLTGAVASMVASELVLATSLLWFLRHRLHWGRFFVTILSSLVAAAGALATFSAFGPAESLAETALANIVPGIAFLAIWLASGDGVRAFQFVNALRSRPPPK